IVILPDVRGLFCFYTELADRFAVAGVAAIAVDYFGRTAGTTPRDASFEYMPHVQQVQSAQVAQDVRAAITYLQQHLEPVPWALFTVGFCFGGTMSFLQDAEQRDLAGVIGFYGSPTNARAGSPSAVDLVSRFTAPVLGFFGGQDQGIPPEAIERFGNALTEAHVTHENVVYPDAPHSFFDRHMEQYQADSADAWQHALAFISSNTPPKP
ncbi:MAG: dienelactone hydrolase family protein, partial [Ktedonobacterales bacterium]